MTSTPEVTNPSRSRWYLEYQFWGLMLFVLCCYAPRLTELTIRGEESRRGRIAWEMFDTGDWIVPRIQGGAVFYRPPLQNWMIALVGKLTGEVDAFAVRFPTLVAMFLTTAILYVYSRSFMSRLGAFAAGTAFTTFAQVLELGRLGETEGLFTLFVAGSLLIWKMLLNRHAHASVIWIAGYSLAALATLTKGPQAPIYFIGPVALFLLLTRRFRLLFSLSNLLGFGVFVAIIAAWQIPFAGQVGSTEQWKIYFRDVGPRFLEMGISTIASHMAVFPLGLFCGALLPWSFLLLAFFSRGFRSRLGSLREDALFCVISFFVTFPSVWLPPGASLRYYMPIYPVVAVLVGIVLERFSLDFAESGRSSLLLKRYWRLLGLVAVGTTLFIAGLSCLKPAAVWSQPLWLAFLLVPISVACAIFLWQRSALNSSQVLQRNLVVVSWMLALFCVSVVPNTRNRISQHAEQEVNQLRASLPAGTHLSSYGITHHLFLFHLREQVTVLPAPELVQEPLPDQGYFCLTIQDGNIPKLPFQWDRIATINCDRNQLPKIQNGVIIGRAISTPMTAASD